MTSAQAVQLTWNAVAGATAYRLERQESAGGFAGLASLSSASLSFLDSSVRIRRTYGYRLIATSSQGDSAPSALAQAYVPDDHGDDPASATPLAIGVPIAGVVDELGDRDLFTVDLNEGEVYRFKATTAGNTALTLSNGAGRVILSSDDRSLTDLSSEIAFVATASGTYRLEVTGSLGALPSYTLSSISSGLPTEALVFFSQAVPLQDKRVVFVVDRSVSMGAQVSYVDPNTGASAQVTYFERVRREIAASLAFLDDTFSFNIVAFDECVTQLWPAARPATAANRGIADSWLAAEGIGSYTNTSLGIAQALADLDDRTLIVVSDGDPNFLDCARTQAGSRDEHLARVRSANLQGARIHTCRLEDAHYSSAFLREVAAEHQGISWLADMTAPPVSTPPPPPSALGATAEHDQVLLEWSASGGLAFTHRIYRREAPGASFDLIAAVDGEAVSYEDRSVAPLTSYTYQVQALNRFGTSPFATVSVSTPSAPSLVFLDDVAPGFRVETWRSPAAIADLASADALIASRPPDATTFLARVDLTDPEEGSRGRFDENKPFPGGVQGVADDFFVVRVSSQAYFRRGTSARQIGFSARTDGGLRLRTPSRIHDHAAGAGIVDLPVFEHHIDSGLPQIGATYFSNSGPALLELYAERDPYRGTISSGVALVGDYLRSGVAGAWSEATQVLPAFRIELRDTAGQVVSAPTPITLALAEDTATLGGTTTHLTVGGRVTFDDITISRPGPWQLVASAPGYGSSLSQHFVLIPEPGAPRATTFRRAQYLGGGEVDLVWDGYGSTNRYELYRAAAGGAFVHLGSFPFNVATYRDSGLALGAVYTYRLIVTNAQVASLPWDIVFHTPPPPPSNFQASTAVQGQIDLSWAPAATSDVVYRLSRRLPGESWTEVFTNRPGTSFSDLNRLPSWTYEYQLEAIGTGGLHGAALLTVQAALPPLAPSPHGFVSETGVEAGGEIVTVFGTGFTLNTTTVSFGGTPATNVVVHEPGRLTCRAPAGSGEVALVVTTPVGGAMASQRFRYVASVWSSDFETSALPPELETPGGGVYTRYGLLVFSKYGASPYAQTTKADFVNDDFTWTTSISVGPFRPDRLIFGIGEGGIDPANDDEPIRAVYFHVRAVSSGQINLVVNDGVGEPWRLPIGNAFGGGVRLRVRKEGPMLTFEGDYAKTGPFAADFGHTLDLRLTATFLSEGTSRLVLGGAQSSVEVGFDDLRVAVSPRPALGLLRATPNFGDPPGGESVVLYGHGLLDGTASAPTVSFGGVAASNVVALDDHRVQCIAPVNSVSGPVSVEVTNARGTTLGAGLYTYRGPFFQADLQNGVSDPHLLYSAGAFGMFGRSLSRVPSVGLRYSSVRTLRDDYQSKDFNAEITFTSGTGIAYLGYGSGVDTAGDPSLGALALRYRGSGLALMSDGVVVQSFPLPPSTGPHRLRIEQAGTVITFSLDLESDSGPFVPDHSHTFPTQPVFLQPGASRLFAGAETSFQIRAFRVDP